MSYGLVIPKAGSRTTNATGYVVIGDCYHVASKEAVIDSMSFTVGDLNPDKAVLRFSYGKKTFFNEFQPGLVEFSFDFDKPPRVPKGATVAMYLKSSDGATVKAVGSFILREIDDPSQIYYSVSTRRNRV